MKTLRWSIFIFFAVGVGLYPLIYLLTENGGGVLQGKPKELLDGPIYLIAFYTHILLGGISLLVGWPQFSAKLRSKNMSLHRLLGRIYIIAVMASGISGFYIAAYAIGGWVSSLGFMGLAIAWLYTTGQAYWTIKQRQVQAHQHWMIRSYALTFAAVTLRLWLPLFTTLLGFSFYETFQVIAWLSWVPNLFVAEWLVRR